MADDRASADVIGEKLMMHMAMMDARLLVIRDLVAALLGLCASPYAKAQQQQIFDMIDSFASERIEIAERPAEKNGRDGFGVALAADMRRDLDFIIAQAKASLG